MKVGDKVKLIKGNPLGKVGIIISVAPLSRSTRGESGTFKEMEYRDSFACKADDGTFFSAFEDDLELLE